jgi:hypothetical protein
MKKIFIVLLFLAIIAVVFPSCERRCICTYNESGAEELIYNAYTKKDCRTYEENLQTLGMDVDCDFK